MTGGVWPLYLPEIAVGDYPIVHVGFVISKLDEGRAELREGAPADEPLA